MKTRHASGWAAISSSLAADFDDEPDQAGIAVGPRLQRPRPQPVLEARRHHADADFFDHVPYAVEMVLAERGCHAGLTNLITIMARAKAHGPIAPAPRIRKVTRLSPGDPIP